MRTVRATRTTSRMTIVFRLISALYQKAADPANVYLNQLRFNLKMLKIFSLFGMIFLLFGCGGDNEDPVPPPDSMALRIRMGNVTGAEGGTVTSDSPTLQGIECGGGKDRCDAVYPAGALVNLVAVPLPGWRFDHWFLQRPSWPSEFSCREPGQRTCRLPMVESLEESERSIQIHAIWNRE